MPAMKHLFWVGLLYLSAGFSALAQIPAFQEYYPLRKNDVIQINGILQDSKGYIWFACSKGLFRFDGKLYERYQSPQEVGQESVTALAEGPNGQIWVGYESGKISYLANNRLELFNPDEGSAARPISDILFDSKGNMWFSTLNDGLYYFISGRLYRVDDAEGLPDLFIYDLEEDANGNIWAGTDGGAAVCSLNGNRISVDVVDYDDGLPDNIVKKILAKSKDTMLLGTEDAGIIAFDLKSKQFQSIVKQPWVYGPVSDFQLKGEKLWVGCPRSGLLLYDFETDRAHLYKSEEIQVLRSIRRLGLDFEGNIWIGTKSGLSRTAGDVVQFIEHVEPGKAANILALTVDNHDQVWYSSPGGLFKTRQNEQGISKPLQNTPFEKFTVISLHTDAKGYVWAGLYGEGVLKIDPETGRIKQLSGELRNGNILNITSDENTVWLSTLGGSCKIALTDVEPHISNYSSDQGLVSDFIYQTFLDGNKVWFATDGKGLAMMDQNGFHHYKDGLPGAVVYGVVRDGKGQIWANVQGNGLYTFDGQTFHPSDSTLALRDRNIHAIATDKSGNIVVMNDAGMDIIDINQNKVIYLGEELGIRDKIGNLNSVARDKHGDLYFGTTNGIIKYTADKKLLTSRPTPVIETVSVFDTPLKVDSIPKLDYDENNITVNFVGIWFQNPDGLNYAYKLDNYDRDWIVTKNHSVTYSKLPPGNYTFKVKTSDSQDFSNALEKSISFSIARPIWQTIPFYVCSAILLVTTVVFIMKSREKKLRRYNELLEEKVQMRTREIQLQNEEIQVQNEEISAQSEEILRINENLEEMVQERTRELERKNKALEEYAFINAHKLRSPVATILGLINLISKTRLDNEGIEINRRLQDTADELDEVVRAITKAIERGDKKIPRLKE
jgi:ligand-binding sensor domain-containing protein